MQRVLDEPFWLLHARPFGEHAQLLEGLSLHHGRVGLVARGSRRRLGAFRPWQVRWNARGELGQLGSAEPLAPALALSGPWLACALYCNELLLRLLPRHDPQPLLFALYGDTLTELWRAAQSLKAVAGGEPAPNAGTWTSSLGPLRRFELLLLHELGNLPSLDHEASGACLVEDALYRMVPGQGLQRCAPEGAMAGRPGLPATAIQRLSAMLRTVAAGQELAASTEVCWSGNDAVALRAITAPLLAQLVPELHSRALFSARRLARGHEE